MYTYLYKAVLTNAGYNPANGYSILYEGPKSLCISPTGFSDRLIKMRAPTYLTFPFLDREAETILMLAELDKDDVCFVVPKLVKHGERPAYIEMTNLGVPYSKWWSRDSARNPDDNAPLIARALGEFSAHLFIKHGLVHRDLFANNYTHYNQHRVGIIDFEEIARGDAEEFFIKPLLYQPNIVPLMSEWFSYVAAKLEKYITIDSESVRTRALQFIQQLPDENQPHVTSNLESNMEEWRRMKCEVGKGRNVLKQSFMRADV